MTSENDDRVYPFHSYKFAARLKNRASQKNPVILRVEKGAGHYGAEGSFKSEIKERADMYNFILYSLNEEQAQPRHIKVNSILIIMKEKRLLPPGNSLF